MSRMTMTSLKRCGSAMIAVSRAASSAAAIKASSGSGAVAAAASNSCGSAVSTTAFGLFLASQLYAVFRTIVRTHARGRSTTAVSSEASARMQASCTTSSASVRLPVSQRASPKASSRCGNTISLKRLRAKSVVTGPPKTSRRDDDLAFHIGVKAAKVGIFAGFVELETELVISVQRLRSEETADPNDGVDGRIVVFEGDGRARLDRQRHRREHELVDADSCLGVISPSRNRLPEEQHDHHADEQHEHCRRRREPANVRRAEAPFDIPGHGFSL